MAKMPEFDGEIPGAPALTGLHDALKDYNKRLQAEFKRYAGSSMPEIAITGQALGAVLDLVDHMLDYNRQQDENLAQRDKRIAQLEARLKWLEQKQEESDVPANATPSKKTGLNL